MMYWVEKSRGLRRNDQRSPGEHLFIMAAETEVFLLFKWIVFDTICASDCVYLTDLLGFGSYTWIYSNKNTQHNIFSLWSAWSKTAKLSFSPILNNFFVYGFSAFVRYTMSSKRAKLHDGNPMFTRCTWILPYTNKALDPALGGQRAVMLWQRFLKRITCFDFKITIISFKRVRILDACNCIFFNV